MATFSLTRSRLVLTAIIVSLLGLMGRVAYLQTHGRRLTLGKTERQHHVREVLPARRGCIFDSTGMLMAGTVQGKSLFVDPKFMQESFEAEGRSLVEMDEAVEKLAALVDRDALELSRLLGDRSSSRFVRIADHLDDGTCDEIRKLDLPGAGLMPMNVRYYPMGSIAAHVLGTVGGDGKGLEALEMKFEPLLAGRDGSKRTLKDARRRAIAVAAEDYVPPQHGQHLILTLDANIQMIAEQELSAICDRYRADRGETVVMDPKTGDVLAMANWPSFNPQSVEDSTADVRRNRCITDPYEPGSTAKPFVVGPALAGDFARLNEVFPINGPVWRTPYNRRITDVHPYSQLALWDVLVKSSNIGMAMLGERMGNPALHRAVSGFGFGRITGIELPGEDAGLIHPLRQWTKYSTDSVAQGYEMMVTPLQLARAFSVYANGGRLVQPRIVRGMLDAAGNVVARNKSDALNMMPEVIDPMTAAEIKRVLCDVPVRGTASKARSRVWNIFGKTGTAHVSKGGHYDAASYTSSFIAGAPAENPRLVVAFVIHEPDREWAVSQNLSYYGGAVAAPGATRLLERALAYLQVPASPDLPPPPPQIADVLYNYDARAYQNRVASLAE